jgi:hypothetical protein
MRYSFRFLLLLSVLASPFAMGCSSQLSEEATPIEASDDAATESPVNDADNP